MQCSLGPLPGQLVIHSKLEAEGKYLCMYVRLCLCGADQKSPRVLWGRA